MLDPSTAAAAGDPGSASSPPAGVAFLSARTAALSRRYQHFLDKSTPFVAKRWGWLGLLAAAYLLRVFLVQGFYVVTYGLGIYVLNLLIAFLSPQEDPEIQELLDPSGPSLPTKSSDEFRPFSRRLPEFKFWCCIGSLLLQSAPNEKRNVLHYKSLRHCFLPDILQCVRCSRVLADSALLLDCAIYNDNEAADSSHDQVQICALHYQEQKALHGQESSLIG